MPVINGKWRPVLPFPITSATAAGDPIGRACLVLGWAFVESTGTTACAFDIIDGNSAAGTLVAPMTLDPGQSRQDELPPDGVFCQSGPFINTISGSWRGSLWLVNVTAAEFLAANTAGG